MESRVRIGLGIPKYSSNVLTTAISRIAVSTAPKPSTRKIVLGFNARMLTNLFMCSIINLMRFLFPYGSRLCIRNKAMSLCCENDAIKLNENQWAVSFYAVTWYLFFCDFYLANVLFIIFSCITCFQNDKA